MTDLALASMFTGAVILIWGFRALRNQYVNVLIFKMHSRYSTWIFGFVSTICGFLMCLTGLAATHSMSAELVEILAKSGLYLFGIGWVLALIMEAIDRVNWRIHPYDTPAALRAKRSLSVRQKPKRKAKISDSDATMSDSQDVEAVSSESAPP